MVVSFPEDRWVELFACGRDGAAVAQPGRHRVAYTGTARFIEKEIEGHGDRKPFVVITAAVNLVIGIREGIPKADTKAAEKCAPPFNPYPFVAGEELAYADFKVETEGLVLIVEIDEVLEAGIGKVDGTVIGEFADFSLKSNAVIAPFEKRGCLKTDRPIHIDWIVERFKGNAGVCRFKIAKS